MEDWTLSTTISLEREFWKAIFNIESNKERKHERVDKKKRILKSGNKMDEW